MATRPNFARRLLTAGGLALAIVAAPTVGALAVSAPSATVTAACPAGEEIDIFTGQCVPFAVPNSPPVFTSVPGNPDIPAVDTGTGAIPCPLPQNCIGLGQSQATGPQVGTAPEATIGGSPTITGSVGP